MSYRVANGAGTSWNDPANWDTGVNTPTVHASASAVVSPGGIISGSFTAPDTTHACTGVLVMVTAVGTAGTITATLQESGADVAGAVATVNITDLKANSLVFFKFTTPYVFTATTAGLYGIKLNTSGASGTTSVASTGSALAYLATMNDNVVPTTGDDAVIAGPNLASLVIDLDADASIGSGTNTSVPAFRSWGNALTTATGGVLSWPTSTNRTLTIKGNYLPEPGGELRVGTEASPIQIGTQARLLWDQNGVTCNYGLVQITGAKFSIYGEELTYKKSLIVSGDGTTATPLVLADTTGWAVGMELVIAPSSDSATNYDETEVKFIRTISGTDITLADTVGGAESGLTYNHDGAPAFNVTRPVLIDTTDTTKAWYGDFNETTDIANLSFNGARFETIGSGVTSRTTLTFSNLATELFTMSDCVFYRINGTQGIQFGNNNDTREFADLIFYDNNAVGNAGALFIASMRNKTFRNCYAIDSVSAGLFLSAASSCDFIDCANYACGRFSSTAQGGFQATNASNIFMEGCESHACRSYGITLATMPGLTAVACEFGTKGKNGSADINCASDNYNTAVFNGCLFGSDTLLNNYANMTDGARVAFHRYNDTDDRHFWYTKYGKHENAGAGLPDTTVKTTGNHSVKITPEDATTGASWTYKVLARPNKFISASGFIRKDATFATDDVTVELYLPDLTPGVDTPSDSVTMPDTTDTWMPFSLAASYTGSIPKYGRVRIVAKSTSTGAIYIADLANGTNDIIGLNVWDEGLPSEIMFEQLGDAAAIWAVLTSTLTTSGTIGYFVTKLLTVAKFLGLR